MYWERIFYEKYNKRFYFYYLFIFLIKATENLPSALKQAVTVKARPFSVQTLAHFCFCASNPRGPDPS